MEEKDIWLLLISNLPIVAAVFVALHRKWIFMGVTVDRELKGKDDEIAYREKLRLEALEDKRALQEQLVGLTTATKELTNIVEKTLQLNEQLAEDMQWRRRWEIDATRRREGEPS